MFRPRFWRTSARVRIDSLDSVALSSGTHGVLVRLDPGVVASGLDLGELRAEVLWLFVGAGFFWLAIMFALALSDYLSRGW